MEWKIKRSLRWGAEDGEYDEPEVGSDTGDLEMHILAADGVEVSADIAQDYVRHGQFHNERVLEEFAAWASTRKGHCVECGDLPVEVDTLDGGIEQSTIKITCPHGVLVVQYHVVVTVATREQVTQDFTDRVREKLALIRDVWHRDLASMPDAAKLASMLANQPTITFEDSSYRTLTVGLRPLTPTEQDEYYQAFRAVNHYEPAERPTTRILRVSVTEYGIVSAGIGSVSEAPDVALEDL